jgi:dienelactone hydrolase
LELQCPPLLIYAFPADHAKENAMKNFLLLAGILFAVIAPAYGAVQGKEVTYRAGHTSLKGYIAWDNAIRGKRPGILVIHEWWGHNAYARKRARMFAKQGYTALALDMYGNGRQARHPRDAQKFSSEVMQNEALEQARFEAALKLLQKQKTVDPDEIAAVGYCFGGAVALNMARIGEPLKAVLSYHGMLETDHPARSGVVKARIASFTGEADPFIPAKDVEAFRQEMDKAGVTYKVVTYPGVKHAFTNPMADKYARKFNLPMAYNAAADKDSWDQGLAILASVFKMD